jgi:hypothetical protein
MTKAETRQREHQNGRKRREEKVIAFLPVDALQ